MARERSENSEQKGTTSKHIEVEIPTFIKIKTPPITIPNDGEFFLDSVLCWVALVVRSQRSQNKWTASPASPPVSPPVSPPASPPLSPPDPLTFMLGLLLLLPSHTNYRIKLVFKIQPKTRYLCQQKLPKTKQLVLDGVGRLHNILHPAILYVVAIWEEVKRNSLGSNDFSKQCLPVKTCDWQFWQLRNVQDSRQSIVCSTDLYFTLACWQKWHCGARSTSRNPYRMETSKLSQQLSDQLFEIYCVLSPVSSMQEYIHALPNYSWLSSVSE